jgi:hypothetical protein
MDNLLSNIPTESQLNVHGSLDEKIACEHFLGKSVEEAKNLLHKDSGKYQEDLMWMGPDAFQYYVIAVIEYLKSEVGRDDFEFHLTFAGTLRFRLKNHEIKLKTVAKLLAETCSWLAAEIKNNAEHEYPELASEYVGLAHHLEATP